MPDNLAQNYWQPLGPKITSNSGFHVYDVDKYQVSGVGLGR